MSGRVSESVVLASCALVVGQRIRMAWQNVRSHPGTAGSPIHTVGFGLLPDFTLRAIALGLQRLPAQNRKRTAK